MKNYVESCAGCQISQGKRCPVGGMIPLGETWVINHYGGPEGYLGWMALQPRFHKLRLADLENDEASDLGPFLRDVESDLSDYWSERFPDDDLERVYVTYFFESVLNTPQPSPYHLHVHIIPRPVSLDPLLREHTDRMVGREFPSTINAWKVPSITMLSAFPERYRKRNESYEELMKWLRSRIVPRR